MGRAHLAGEQLLRGQGQGQGDVAEGVVLEIEGLGKQLVVHPRLRHRLPGRLALQQHPAYQAQPLSQSVM